MYSQTEYTKVSFNTKTLRYLKLLCNCQQRANDIYDSGCHYTDTFLLCGTQSVPRSIVTISKKNMCQYNDSQSPKDGGRTSSWGTLRIVCDINRKYPYDCPVMTELLSQTHDRITYIGVWILTPLSTVAPVSVTWRCLELDSVLAIFGL